MEMMGYQAPDLPTLFGQHFEDVDPRWTQMFEPQFEAARTALGELPGLRGGMLGQLRGGLQERGLTAGRGLQARRAGAGFAGAGALDRMGRTARRGLEEEYGRGMWGIGQDIARKRAGVLGGLRGRIGSFLEMLMAADTEPAAGDGAVPPADFADYDAYVASIGMDMSYDEWVAAGRPAAGVPPGLPPTGISTLEPLTDYD